VSDGLTVLRRLVRVSAPPWGRLLAATAFGVAGAAATIGLMAGSGYVVGRAAFRPGLGAIAGILALVEVMAFLRAPLRYEERLVVHDAAFRALTAWRVWLYDRLEPLSPAGLSRFRSGDLLTRAVEDVDSLQDLYVRALAPVAIAIAGSVLGVVVVALVLPAAGAVLAACIAVALVAGPLLALTARHAGAEELELRAELAADTVDLLQGAPDLLAFGADGAALDRVTAADEALSRLARRRAVWAGAASAVVLLAIGAAVLGVLIVGIDALRGHQLHPALLAVLPLAVIGTFEPVPAVLAAALHVSDVTAAGRRLLELDVAPPVTDPQHPKTVPAGCPEIAFEGARLRYADDAPWALDGVDLPLAPGSRTVVVGPSGAGKTSLVNALLRFWPLADGRVRADDVDLAEVAQTDARTLVGLSDQHARLFSWSLRRNIALGRPDATDKEIDEVVRRAQLGQFVDSLPDGLETPVGEQGAQVSGGQRRRIALARALLTSAPLLVLDEPTAGLDEETADRLLTDVLAATGRGADEAQSLLVITHDRRGLESLPTVSLDGGRVVGVVPGTPAATPDDPSPRDQLTR
jgi:thiol reductant ABC exporter CydC subunit